MGIDMKARTTEAVHREPQETNVLKHATAQGDSLETRAFPETTAGPDDHVGQGGMKATPDLLRSCSREDVFDHPSNDLWRLHSETPVLLAKATAYTRSASGSARAS